MLPPPCSISPLASSPSANAITTVSCAIEDALKLEISLLNTLIAPNSLGVSEAEMGSKRTVHSVCLSAWGGGERCRLKSFIEYRQAHHGRRDQWQYVRSFGLSSSQCLRSLIGLRPSECKIPYRHQLRKLWCEASFCRPWQLTEIQISTALEDLRPCWAVFSVLAL